MASAQTARRHALPRSTLLVEGVRLAIVAVATTIGFEVGVSGVLPAPIGNGLVIAAVLLGAGGGYVLGGVVGRGLSRALDRAEGQLRRVPASQMLTTVLGGLVGLGAGVAVAWPLVLVGAWRYTLPLAVLALLVTASLGARVGAERSGDLLGSLGVGGRLPVGSPSTAPRLGVVDTSALIDGRVLAVCRSGFLDATLVIPRVVVGELQRLADAGDEDVARRGRRGLDVLAGLQRAQAGVEICDRDHPEIAEVDAKLVALAAERDASLVTCDANLGRVAEVQGVAVLNLHRLAEELRPPVLPGERIDVSIIKPGKEPGQGVGYLDDGTMVVVERARQRKGETVASEVTSVLATAHGRLVFATLTGSSRPVREASSA
jgi:uncharacterized protein YacL